MRDLNKVVQKKAAKKAEPAKPVQQPAVQKTPDALAALAADTVAPAQQGRPVAGTPADGTPAAASPADRTVLPSVMAKVRLEGVKPLEAHTLERGDKCVVPFRIVSFGLSEPFMAVLSNGTIVGSVTGFELQMQGKFPRLVIKLRVDTVPASGGLLIPDDRRIQMGFGVQTPIQVLWLGDGPTAQVGYDLSFLYLGQKGTVQTEGDPLDSVIHSFGLRVLNGIPELLVTFTDPSKRPFCAHCGYDFRPRGEKSCPSCKTVRGESAPPAQSTPTSAVASWSGSAQAPQPTPPVLTPPVSVAPQAQAPAVPDPTPAAQFRTRREPAPKLWWVQQGQNVYGPYDPNQLKGFIAGGKLSPDDLLQHPKSTAGEWRQLSNIGWLAALLPASAAQQPASASGHQATHVEWLPPGSAQGTPVADHTRWMPHGDGGQPAAQAQPVKYSPEWVQQHIRCECCRTQLQPYPNNKWCPNATCAAPQQYS